MPWHLGRCWCWRDCPCQDEPIESQQLTCECTFQIHISQFRAHTPATSSIRISCTGLLSTCPECPGPGTRQLGLAPMLHALLKSFKVASPNTAQPVLPIPSHRNHSRDICPQTPLSLCFLTGPGMLLPLRNCEQQSTVWLVIIFSSFGLSIPQISYSYTFFLGNKEPKKSYKM